jgi:hypothetical protein
MGGGTIVLERGRIARQEVRGRGGADQDVRRETSPRHPGIALLGSRLTVQAPEEQACITGQHGFFLVVIEEVESLDDRS